MEPEPRYVGIDVAKARLEVAVRPTGEGWTSPYDEAAVQGLVSQLEQLEPVMVLLEASGGLEVPLVAALAVGDTQTQALNSLVARRARKGQSGKNQVRWNRNPGA